MRWREISTWNPTLWKSGKIYYSQLLPLYLFLADTHTSAEQTISSTTLDRIINCYYIIKPNILCTKQWRLNGSDFKSQHCKHTAADFPINGCMFHNYDANRHLFTVTFLIFKLLCLFVCQDPNYAHFRCGVASVVAFVFVLTLLGHRTFVNQVDTCTGNILHFKCLNNYFLSCTMSLCFNFDCFDIHVSLITSAENIIQMWFSELKYYIRCRVSFSFKSMYLQISLATCKPLQGCF